MKIAILCHDISTNAYGRAWILARALSIRHEVEILGPDFGRNIWAPLAAEPGQPVRKLSARTRPGNYLTLKRLLRNHDCDVVYAVKPLLGTLLAGLASGRRPLVLDIDDWETGFLNAPLESGTRQGLLGWVWRPLRAIRLAALRSFAPRCERATKRADAITVSSQFLQRKFGGTIVVHGRDTERFDPARYPSGEAKGPLGLPPNRPVVMFLGTPKRHKGISDLIDAMRTIGGGNALLALVGFPEGHRLRTRAEETLGNDVRVFGHEPFERIPEFLAAADVVTVPQRESPATVGQTPAKVFDAMAMARPLVVTSVADLPEIVADGGWIVPPGNPAALAVAIKEALENREEAKRRGRAARERCIERYSLQAMSRVLEAVLAQAAGARTG